MYQFYFELESNLQSNIFQWKLLDTMLLQYQMMILIGICKHMCYEDIDAVFPALINKMEVWHET